MCYCVQCFFLVNLENVPVNNLKKVHVNLFSLPVNIFEKLARETEKVPVNPQSAREQFFEKCP